MDDWAFRLRRKCMSEPAKFCLHFLRQNRALPDRSCCVLGFGSVVQQKGSCRVLGFGSVVQQKGSCRVLGFGSAVQLWAAEGTQMEQKQKRGTERGDRDWRKSSSCRVLRFGAAEGTQTEQKQRRGTERGDRDWRERAIDSKNSSYPVVLQIVCW